MARLGPLGLRLVGKTGLNRTVVVSTSSEESFSKISLVWVESEEVLDFVSSSAFLCEGITVITGVDSRWDSLVVSEFIDENRVTSS